MGTPPQQTTPSDLERPKKFNPQRLGNVSQIASALLSALSVFFVFYFHSKESAGKTSDEHVISIVDQKINAYDTRVAHQFELIEGKIDSLTEKVGEVDGKLSRMSGRVSEQSEKQGQLLAASAIVNPSRVLTVIRTEIQQAKAAGRTIPPVTLVEYKEAFKTVPDSATQYWITLAEIINYQSLMNQLAGYAPDPQKVSHPCAVLTDNGATMGNVIIGGKFDKCIVDLDTTHNLIQGVVFTNSVIRYHGGPVTLDRATFINCYFELDVFKAPARPGLLFALLDSNQRRVTLSTHA